MEIKVNEIFEFEGTNLQAIETEDMTCTECFFKYRKVAIFIAYHLREKIKRM